MKSIKSIVVLGAALLAVGVASTSSMAQSPVNTYGELAALKSKNAILKVQVDNAEMEKKLGDSRGGSNVPGSRPADVSSGTVRVMQVDGVSKGLIAKIQLADGGMVAAGEGKKIPGLGTVTSVRADEVLVQNGKQTISLPFASEPTSNVMGSSAMPGIPQMPMVR